MQITVGGGEGNGREGQLNRGLPLHVMLITNCAGKIAKHVDNAVAKLTHHEGS